MAEEQCSACKAFFRPDGTPACACGADEPVKQTADTDSFGPLRVRPYFSSVDTEGTGSAPEPDEPQVLRTERGVPAGLTLALTTGAPGHQPPGHRPRPEDLDLFSRLPGTGDTTPGPDATPETGTGRPTDRGGPPSQAGPHPVPEAQARDGGEEDSGDEGALVVIGHPEPAGEKRREQARRRGGPIAIAAAVVAAGAVAAVLATGLLGDGEEEEQVRPDPTRAAPTAPAPTAEEPGTPSALPSRPGSAPAKPGTAAATATKPAAGTVPTTPTRATGEVTTAPRPTSTGGGRPGASSPDEPHTLRPGDSGPEVEELQRRLKQVYIFYLSPADGEYDSEVARWVSRFQKDQGIKDDPDGVYGPATRRALEAMTREP